MQWPRWKSIKGVGQSGDGLNNIIPGQGWCHLVPQCDRAYLFYSIEEKGSLKTSQEKQMFLSPKGGPNSRPCLILALAISDSFWTLSRASAPWVMHQARSRGLFGDRVLWLEATG